MMKRRFKGPKIAGFILLGIGFATLAIWLLMFLWNTVLVAAVSGIKIISFWQAAGLFVLAKILFGGFKKGHRAHGWKNKMREKWESMNEEEREKFKAEWKHKCFVRKNKTENTAGAE
jgi:hypothetical protein